MCSVNTLVWDESSTAVNTGIVDFHLDNCAVDSQSLMRRKRSAVQSSNGETIMQVELTDRQAVNLSVTTANFTDDSKCIYHSVNLTDFPSDIVFTVYPLHAEDMLDLFVSTHEKPNSSQFLWHKSFTFVNFSAVNNSRSSSFLFIPSDNFTNITTLFVCVSYSG